MNTHEGKEIDSRMGAQLKKRDNSAKQKPRIVIDCMKWNEQTSCDKYLLPSIDSAEICD